MTVVYLTRGEKSRGYPWLSERERAIIREQEARNSCRVLGVDRAVFLGGTCGEIGRSKALLAELSEVLREIRPLVAYVPHRQDRHEDHAAAFHAFQAVTGEMDAVTCEVRAYEVWTPLSADIAVDISRHMSGKLKALKCHKLALDAFDYVHMVKGLASYRCGTLLRREGYAEAFARVRKKD